MIKIKTMGMLLLPAMLSSCSTSRKIEVRAMPVPQNAAVADSESLMTGRMLFERGEYALAADAFRKAVRQDPDSADAYNGLAASYDNLGRYDLSRRYYELALAMAPEDGRILRNLARSMMGQGDRLAARKLLAEAAALDQGKAAGLSEQAQPMAAALENEDRPFHSGMGAVTVAVAPATPEVGIDLPAAEPVVATPSLFQRVAAVVTRALPEKSSEVSIPIAPAAREIAPVPAPAAKPARLHIMNAVGRKHQAARMRIYLADSGWSGASTGDSRAKLLRSRILYRTKDEAAAKKLSASLPFKPRLQPAQRVPALFLMLGRDAVPFDRQLLQPKQG